MEITNRIKETRTIPARASCFSTSNISPASRRSELSIAKTRTAYTRPEHLREPLKLRFMALERFSVLRLERELVK